MESEKTPDSYKRSQKRIPNRTSGWVDLRAQAQGLASWALIILGETAWGQLWSEH